MQVPGYTEDFKATWADMGSTRNTEYRTGASALPGLVNHLGRLQHSIERGLKDLKGLRADDPLDDMNRPILSCETKEECWCAR